MIRRLTIDDIKVFRDIREEAMRTNPESFSSPEEEEGGERQETAYRQLLKESEIWGAFDGENLVGVTGFHLAPQKKYGDVFGLYVRNAFRRKGLGDQLLKKISSEAESRVDQLHLCVVQTAEAAIKSCLQNGFAIVQTEPQAFSVGGVSYDEHLMVKNFR
jgi:ribosomal protein S18 acetylase RimI-like enzyme